jgi:hypothetical protein
MRRKLIAGLLVAAAVGAALALHRMIKPVPA